MKMEVYWPNIFKNYYFYENEMLDIEESLNPEKNLHLIKEKGN